MRMVRDEDAGLMRVALPHPVIEVFVLLGSSLLGPKVIDVLAPKVE